MTENPGRSKIRRGAARGIAIIAGYEGMQAAFDRALSFYKENYEYSVTITDDDPIYDDVHAWVLKLMPADNARSLLLGARENSSYLEVSASSESGSVVAPVTPLQLSFNDQKERRLVIAGHPVKVGVQRPDREVKSSGYVADKIRFACRSRAAQQAIIEHVQTLHKNRKQERLPLLRMVDQWGQWRQRADLPERPIESVVLPPEQMSRIIADLQAFLNQEDQYRKLAIPWHRGLMLHGPPGSGKTSLVKALATHFGMDLWYISLSDLKEESSLLALLSNVSPRSLLLLEDIDTIKISHDRDTEQGKISMTSLLNALDGVATPHGLITVMTTNHLGALDPALTRPGRVDRIEEIKSPTWREVAALFERYYGIPLDASGMSSVAPAMASVAEVFKRSLFDPDSAEAHLRELDVEPDRVAETPLA